MKANPFGLLALAYLVATTASLARADDDSKHTADAYAALQKRCAACHHDDRNGNEKYDVLSWDSLTSEPPSARVRAKYPQATAYIKAKKPDESLVLLRIKDKKMPKGKAISDDERKELVETLTKWIDGGAGKEGFSK